jgi:NAD(P)-dependent dehydrogenase (short-subunit alcohol dehydrogenase family)
MPVRTLRNQTVVIIGGSSGMGYAVAEGAPAEGARIVIGSSNEAKIDATAQRVAPARQATWWTSRMRPASPPSSAPWGLRPSGVHGG